MRRALRWVGWGLGGVVATALTGCVVLYVAGGRRLNRLYDVEPERIGIPTDSMAIARGRHLATALLFCHSCHGDDLGGGVVIEMPGIVMLRAPNLTAGAGGAGTRFDDADFLRAIRHGVSQQGRALLIMHSDAYNNLGRDDLAAVVAHVKSMPPVDREIGTSVRPLGRVMVALGLFDGPIPLMSAEVIDHTATFRERPNPDTTAAYGGYLVSIALCRMCHGADLTGGPPVDPSYPAGPNVLHRAGTGGWTRDQFVTLMRTGMTPDGRALNAEWMPWESFRNMTDEELVAVWKHLEMLASQR